MRYDLASSSWRTSAATSLWDLEMSSPTFPEWGMTHGGELYELPTPERPTAGLASSSLPTPNARDWKEQTLGWQHTRDGVIQEDLLPRALTALLYSTGDLLPTPSANDTTGAEPAAQRGNRNAGGPLLRDLPHLLPTPTVMDMGANYTPEEWDAWKAKQRQAHQNGNGHGASLTQEAISLLPTPKAGDGERGRDLPRMREDTKSRELATAAGSIGASTPPQLPDGSASSDAPHPAPPSRARPDDPDCLPYSWNG
jgi:hypothetical protein